MPLVLIFLVLPLVEIALFIVIGGRIGLWPTLALIVLGGIAGIFILRAHKARAIEVMKRGLRGASPGTFLAQGAFQVVGGLLLILPGFLTDALGVLLLLPPVQRAILRWGQTRVKVREVHLRATRAGASPGRGDVIEGEYEASDETRQPVDPPRRVEERHDDPRSH
jgi:UPF0716 protein FxsA